MHQSFDNLRDLVDYRPDTSVWSIEHNVAFTFGPDGVRRVPFTALLLCTGGVDRVLPMPGWTLPGAYTLGGSQIALKAQGCAIGKRTAFIGSGPLLYLVAYQYAHAGAKVAAVLDTAGLSDALPVMPYLLAGGKPLLKGLWYQNWIRLNGLCLKRGVRPITIEGDVRVSGLRYRTAFGRERRVDKEECQKAGVGNRHGRQGWDYPRSRGPPPQSLGLPNFSMVCPKPWANERRRRL